MFESPRSPRARMSNARPDARPTRVNEKDLPQYVGRFFVLRRLGAGAMSQVLLCYDDDLDRKLAIKLLKTGRREHDRVWREAQALAQLSHPNVVHVYEFGEFQDTLYLALEYVRGETLATHVKDRSVAEIVGVYMQAGRGLAAAHKVGLVHRDFKPANVMVGTDGRVRVLDFGLARGEIDIPDADDHGGVSARDPALWSEMTQAGIIVGTPSYMAPEQWRGDTVDARSDQFAFCVALWEALYGHRPFLGSTLEALRESILDGKREDPPMDAKVPEWLRRTLERGLALEPDARWATMDDLLAALDHGGARRKRTLRVVAALALVAAAGVLLGAWRWREAQFYNGCVAEGGRITEVWNDEVRAGLRAAFVAADPQFGAATFERVVPFVDRFTATWSAIRAHACVLAREHTTWTPDTAARAEECLFDARLSLESSLAVLSRTDATSLPRAVHAVTELPQVGPCLDAGSLARRSPLPSEQAARAEALELRRGLQEVRSLHAAGRYRDARARVDELLPRADALAWGALLADAGLVAGMVAAANEDLPRAEALLEGGLVHAAGVDDEVMFADIAASLAEVVGTRGGRQDEGLRWGRVAHAMASAQGDGGGARGARVLHTLARLHHDRGEYDDAERLHAQALTLELDRLGADHPDVARALVHLARIHAVRRRDVEAKATYIRALDLRRRTLGPDHPDVALTLNDLAVVYRNSGQLDEAQRLDLQALEIRERVLGPTHPDVARSLRNLGVNHVKRDQHGQAQRLFERALTILERVLGPEHPELAVTLTHLGELYQRRGKYEQARRTSLRALDLIERAHGRGHIDSGRPRLAVGQAELLLGRSADAARRFTAALAVFERSGLAVETADAQFALARALWPRKPQRPRARELVERAVETFRTRGEVDRAAELTRWLADRDAPDRPRARRG